MSKDVIKIAGWTVLIAVCVGSFALALPTINSNINDPSMIIYFDADEGGLMDKAWYYYSGEKRDSFQWDNDYGLELVYIADFARLVLSHFMTITPGSLVLMARWIHLLSWIAALIALWYFIGYHFTKGWQQVAAVTLVSVRPSFAYFLDNLKPEPLILLLSIAVLHFAFKIIERPSARNLVLATALTTLAFVIKYTGLFLLPPIIASLYFNRRYSRLANKQENKFSNIRFSWLMPFAAGALLLIMLWAALCFYVRQSTGTSWCKEFGFWGSLSQNKFGIYLFALSLVLIASSLMIWFVNKMKLKTKVFKPAVAWINEIDSYVLVIGTLFLVFILIFGIRWLITPSYFVLVYSLLGPSAVSKPSISESASVFSGFTGPINAFDPIIFLLLLSYLGAECYKWRDNFRKNSLMLFKRLVLLVFIVPAFALMFSGVRMAKHHMLIFFFAASVLVVQGIEMFREALKGRIWARWFVIFAGVLLTVNIILNASDTIRARIIKFHRSQDIIFDFAKWFRQNVPPEAVIVSDHHRRIYVPPEYKNIKIFRGYQTTGVEQLRELVRTYNPEFICYNEGPSKDAPLPPIGRMLPDTKVLLLESFDSEDRGYQRFEEDRFVVYRVLN